MFGAVFLLKSIIFADTSLLNSHFPMKRITCLFACLIFLSASLSAQSVKNQLRQIDRHGDSYYWVDNNVKLTDDECHSILDMELYSTYKSAQKQFNKGKGWLTLGLVCAGSAVATLVIASQDNMRYEDRVLYANMATILEFGADVGICLGCVFRGIGKGRMEWVKDTYNEGKSTASRVGLSPSLMLTAQRDIGLGATLSFSF